MGESGVRSTPAAGVGTTVYATWRRPARHFGGDAFGGGVDAGFYPGAAGAAGFEEACAVAAELFKIARERMIEMELDECVFEPA